MTSRAVQVEVSGLVQGVGFRWSTVDQAQRLGLNGWVRNLLDGSVEAWVEGRADAVAQMIEWLQHGPTWARVQRCRVSEQTPLGIRGFHVR
ncbi:MAG: acylphosphatase [Propionibacterium sp.]|nr:acylphosphatase [Propionibacterium sp.]